MTRPRRCCRSRRRTPRHRPHAARHDRGRPAPLSRRAGVTLPVVTLPPELAQAVGSAVLDVAEASVTEFRRVRWSVLGRAADRVDDRADRCERANHVGLSSELRSAVALSATSCAAGAGRPQSSLVAAGRGGLSQDPDADASLPALYFAGRDLRLDPGVAAPHADGGGEPPGECDRCPRSSIRNPLQSRWASLAGPARAGYVERRERRSPAPSVASKLCVPKFPPQRRMSGHLGTDTMGRGLPGHVDQPSALRVAVIGQICAVADRAMRDRRIGGAGRADQRHLLSHHRKALSDAACHLGRGLRRPPGIARLPQGRRWRLGPT